MVDRDGSISVAKQCELLGLHRSGLYYQPAPESPMNLAVMRLIDKIYTKHPFLGSRKMVVELRHQGLELNRKRVQRLMRAMGIEAIYCKPKTTIPAPGHRIYPYLLRNVRIERPDHVWSADITYLPMQAGFMYLVAIIDWFSRYVLSWELSNTIDASFCVLALKKALARGEPLIFNTDQGSQFTAGDFTGPLEAANIQISMNGKGRALDNIFIERLWRTVKYEEVFLHEYLDGHHAISRLTDYFQYYNKKRPHQALGYLTPEEVYRGGQVRA